MEWRAPLAILSLIACGRIDFDLRGGGGDAGGGDAGDSTACEPTAWTQPRRLVASSDAVVDDLEPALHPSGLAIVFVSARPTGLSDLYVTTRPTAADEFGAATLLTALSGTADEFGPSWSSDGAFLHFQRGGAGNLVTAYYGGALFDPPQPSDLYGEHGVLTSDELETFSTEFAASTDLAYASRDQIGGTWTESNPYGALNTARSEGFPSFDDSRQMLYFERELVSGRTVIATSIRGGRGQSFGVETITPELEVAGDNDVDPDVSLDGLALVFASDRAPSASFDLFLTTRDCVSNL